MSKILCYIDTETGDTQPFNGVVLSHGKMVNMKGSKSDINKTEPPFIWFRFKYGEHIYQDMKPANITRLIYAATFSQRDGKLMKKKYLKDVMNLGKDAWCEFINDMMQREIFYIKDKFVYLDMSNFTLCEDVGEESFGFTRIYRNSFQKLYESCGSITDHKRLSYLIKAIPFVNRKFNILCKNPLESNKEDVLPISHCDFCEILGLDRGHAMRVLKEILRINIDSIPVLYLNDNNLNKGAWKLFVCQNLYYGGDYGAQRNEVLDNYKKLLES